MATSYYSGADPVCGTQNPATYDTSGDMAPMLEITHTYYQQATLVDEGSFHHVVTGSITLTNKGTPDLDDVSILVNMDCEANIHTAYLCDADGNQVKPPTITFPDLPQGSQPQTQVYHWTLKRIENSQEPGPFAVTPKLNPRFTVSYRTLPTYAQSDTTTVNLS